MQIINDILLSLFSKQVQKELEKAQEEERRQQEEARKQHEYEKEMQRKVFIN